MGNLKLGPREAQVLDLIVEGWKNDEIAEGLGMASRTVKAHCSKLFFRYRIDGGSNELKRIKLAVMVFYERNPNRVPFCDGDRASLLGQKSASVFAAERQAIECANLKQYYSNPRTPQLRGPVSLRERISPAYAEPV